MYSTYLNGLTVWDVAIDKADNVYIGGLGVSKEFVLKNSLQGYLGGGINAADHAVMMFAHDGKTLIYSTLIGGRGNEQGVHLAIAADGSVFAAGATGSVDYPMKNAYQPVSGGNVDGVLFRLTESTIPQIPAFTPNPSQLTFRFVQGESVPPTQSIVVNGEVNGLVATAIEPWLGVTPALAIIVNPAGLPPGVYRGTVRLTPPSGVAGTLDVMLVVLAAAPILAAVEPARLATGSDDTEVTLRGAGFSSENHRLKAVAFVTG